MVARLPMKWRKPMAQARAIAERKTVKGRAAAIHAWCMMCKEALRGDVPVRGVQPDPVADMDAGPCAEVRGAHGLAPDQPDGPRVPDPGGSQTRIPIEEAA